MRCESAADRMNNITPCKGATGRVSYGYGGFWRADHKVFRPVIKPLLNNIKTRRTAVCGRID